MNPNFFKKQYFLSNVEIKHYDVMIDGLNFFDEPVKSALFQRKTKQGQLRTYVFEKPPGIFIIVTLPLEIPDKTSFHHWNFIKILWHAWKFQGRKAIMEIPHNVFSIIPGKSTSFSWPLDFPHASSSNTPGNSMLSPLHQRTYNNIRKIAVGQGDGYITCYLLDYVCFKIILRWQQ